MSRNGSFQGPKQEILQPCTPSHVPPYLLPYIQAQAKHGMTVIPVHHFGNTPKLRHLLGMRRGDYGVVGFMASSKTNIAAFREITQSFPLLVADVAEEFHLNMPLINGGGTWKGEAPDHETGLMGHWAWAATRHGRQARMIIMESLLEKEGLPVSRGITVCLLRHTNCIGDRGDELIKVGALFPVLPGGIGTTNEETALLTEGIIGVDDFKRFALFYDPLVTDPYTGGTKRLLGHTLDDRSFRNNLGTISDYAARKVNSHAVVYQPGAGLSIAQQREEMLSITLAFRAAAPFFDRSARYTAVPQACLDKYVKPLSPTSRLVPVFARHPIGIPLVHPALKEILQPFLKKPAEHQPNGTHTPSP